MRATLFLDIDGVLNGAGSFDEVAMSSTFDPACVQRLNSVFARVDCEVVLSTSWRYMVTGGKRGIGEWMGACTLRGFEYLLRTHRLHVVGRMAGCTPPDEFISQRGDQILHWLKTNENNGVWAAIDDEVSTSMDKLGDRLVRTNPDTGMTDADADRLVALLQARP